MRDPTKVFTLVCDDEPDARDCLVDLLRRDADIVLVGEPLSGTDVATEIARLSPDLVFLGIEAPMLDGLTAISTTAAEHGSPVVVFVTACEQYALKAFEVHALDYLLKPFSAARFTTALSVAKARVRERRACELARQIVSLLQPSRELAAGAHEPAASRLNARPSARRAYLEHLMVRLGGKLTLVRVDDIDWIEADDYYAKLHVASRTYLVRQTMQQLEAKLDPRQFVRVHRSAIIRLDRLQTLEPYLKGSHVLTLKDGTRLALSRARRWALEAALGASD